MTHETGDVRQVIERLNREARHIDGNNSYATDVLAPLMRVAAEFLEPLTTSEMEQERATEAENERLTVLAQPSEVELLVGHIKHYLGPQFGTPSAEHRFSFMVHAINYLGGIKQDYAKLASQPAPSGWQQRIEAAFREGYDFGQADRGWHVTDADGAWSKSDTRQNAVDALPPAPEVKDRNPRIEDESLPAEPDAKDAIPPPQRDDEPTDEVVNAAIDDLAAKAKRLYRGSDGHSRGVFAEIDRKSEMLKRMLNTPADVEDAVTMTSRQHSNTCDLVGFQQGYNAPGVCSCGADASLVEEPNS